MKKKIKCILITLAGCYLLSTASAQNVSLNMLVLNSGVVPLNGSADLQATVNATQGTAGQTNAVAAGKVNVQITVPPSLTIAATQNNLPAGWVVRNNNGTVINLCNSGSTIPVNSAVNLLIELQGVTVTTGSPTLSGQISFRTNCSAPGSLAGDNTSDNSSQAGFSVSGSVPVRLSAFSAEVLACQPSLKWVTTSELNSEHFELQRTNAATISWTNIAVVTARGSEGVQTSYEYLDRTAGNSKWLYRLKQVDEDGKFVYSTILPVANNCKGNQLTAFPNPVQHGMLYVSATGVDQQNTSTLLSATGQLVKRITLRDGTNQVDVSTLTAGMYILNTTMKDGTQLQSKVIIR